MRKLLPALYFRHRDGDLPAHGRILGLARETMSRDEFVAKVEASFASFVPAADIDKEPSRALRSGWTTQGRGQHAPGFRELAERSRTRRREVRVFFLSTAPDFFAPICKNLAAAGLVTRNSRVVLEKPLGPRPGLGAEDQRGRRQRLRRAADLPHRPLPGQGAGAEPAGAALRQRPVGAAVEPHLGAQRADHHRRAAGRGNARRLLRPHRRAARHGAEPPAAAAVHRGDGAAHFDPPGRGSRRKAEGPARAEPFTPGRRRDAHRPRPVPRGHDQRPARAGLPRGNGHPARQRHRNLSSPSAPSSKLALVRRAVLPAHRQAHGRARGRDRGELPRRCRIRSSRRREARRATGW